MSADRNQIFFGQLAADEKRSAIYRASLGNEELDQIYYEEDLLEIIVYNLIER